MSDVATFLGGAFNPSEHEPTRDFEVLPPGDYPVIIEAACIKETKARTGHYIELTLQVLDGPAKGRKLWDRLNIDNQNTTAVEIAKRQLAAIGQAIGIVLIEDTDQLVNQVLYAVVKVKGDNNEVRTYINAQQAGERAAKSGASMQPAPTVPTQSAVPSQAPVQTVLQQPTPTQVAPQPATNQPVLPPGRYVPGVAGVDPALKPWQKPQQ
jgi:hypothetical protein